MKTNKINLNFPNIVFFLIILFFASLYFYKAYTYLHIDYGWYIREGELILKEGLYKSDYLSYTMPSYSYINHEWLSLILVYLFQSKFGLVLVSCLFALIAIVSVLIQVPKRHIWASAFPVVASLSILYPFFGNRIQVIGWLFFSVLLKLYFDQKLWLKFRKFVPLIMLLWVNMHGSFFVGIFLLTYFLFVDFFKKRLSINGIIIYVFSILITLLNPYSYFLWWEVIRQFFDINQRNLLGEWSPFFVSFSILIAIYFVTALTLIFIYRKRISREFIVILLVLLLSAVSTIRNIPFFIIVSIPVITISLHYLNSKENRFNKEVLTYLLLIFIGFFLVRLAIDYSLYMNYSEQRVYPKNALKYLKENLPEKEIFSIYEWGGYLDWKLPEKKVFIDGRMITWRHSKNYKNESNNAYKEYGKILNGELDLKDVIEKYKIGTILYHSKSFYPENISDPFYSKLDSLEDWEVVYSDEVAIIYQPKNEQ